MADTPKSTPIILGVIALLIGYAGWSGDGLNLLAWQQVHQDAWADHNLRRRGLCAPASHQRRRGHVDGVKLRHQPQCSSDRMSDCLADFPEPAVTGQQGAVFLSRQRQ